MRARGEYVLSQLGPLGKNTAFLEDGYVSGGTAITVARRNFTRQFLHYHRAGHGAVASPQTQRGYTAVVHTKISRIIGASGIHVGTTSVGKLEGERLITHRILASGCGGSGTLLQTGMGRHDPDNADLFRWRECIEFASISENLGHSNVILMFQVG